MTIAEIPSKSSLVRLGSDSGPFKCGQQLNVNPSPDDDDYDDKSFDDDDDDAYNLRFFPKLNRLLLSRICLNSDFMMIIIINDDYDDINDDYVMVVDIHNAG